MSVNADDITPTPQAAAQAFCADAASSGVPTPYLRALRYGTPGHRYRITVTGRPVTITLAAGTRRADPARELQSWIELRNAVVALDSDCVTDALPRELAAATWRRDGRTIRARRPRARRRWRLTALSPLPILAELIPAPTAVTGAAAVTIALTPLPPALHDDPTPPRTPPSTAITGGDIARPEPGYLPGFLRAPDDPVPPMLRPADAAADTAPRPDTGPPWPLPPAPAPSTPPGAPSATPEPSPTPSIDTTSPAPDVDATRPLVTTEPTTAPSSAPVASPTSTPRTRGHGPRTRPRHAHHRHGHGHGHGRR